jgi:hypothetical protein
LFAIVLTAVFAVLLLVAVRSFVEPHDRKRVAILLLAGYLVRLVIHTFARDLHLFSAGGLDAGTYEAGGMLIAKLWTYSGIHYVTAEELPYLARTTLPQNLFAFIFYINGESTGLGGTAIIAFLASMTCLNVYAMAVHLGAHRSAAFRITGFLLFMPTFVFYTSDMFKEGIVYFGIFLILGSSMRMARKFSVGQLIVGLSGLVCVWLTRYYLCYVLPIPLLIGCLGSRSGSLVRALVAVLALVVSVGSIAAYTSAAGSAANDASETFEHGTSQEVVGSNAETGGSGVTFDDGGSPFSSLPAKLLYTLFSPFPWQSGSIGLQLAKIEVLGWYYLAYRIVLAAKFLWRERRTDFIIILSFVGPTTLVYAVMFANIGLNIRERIAIVIASAVLASVSWRGSVGEADESLAAMPLPADS